MQLTAAISSSVSRLGNLGNRAITVLSVLLLALMLTGSTLLYMRSLSLDQTIPGVRLGSTALGAVDYHRLDGVISDEARRHDAVELTLTAGGRSMKVSRSQLGVQVDRVVTRARLQRLGKSGNFLRDLIQRVHARRGRLAVPLAVKLDHRTALAFFSGLKQRLDRAPVAARLDLEKGVVVPGSEGYRLRIYDSLAVAELAINRGATMIPLAITTNRAAGDRFKDLKINHVLGHFTTAYSLKEKDKDRGHNLKVGASKLDGLILGPGEQLSYNKTVGARSEAQGYRMATVINEGELVDGMAGGSCQLSSTLFAASFFAGLELVNSRPHTRPSSYIKMGLDATVSYPTIDMVIKNPYPFPVVMHFKVNQGRVRVRILGRRRPWRKVVFEREVKEQTPFKEVERKDESVPRGNRYISQRGVPGFHLERRRLLFGKGDKPQRVERRQLNYPPTTQYVRVGAGPAIPDWKPPRKKAPFGDVPKQFSMER